MRFTCATAVMFSAAAALLAPASVAAQSEADKAPSEIKKMPSPPSVTEVPAQQARRGLSLQPDPSIWLPVTTDKGRNYVHAKSGAICADTFRDLTLTAITDYAPDGTNSGCQYDRVDEAGLSRLTLYIYTAEGLTGPIAYKGAKDAITQFHNSTPVTVTERTAEGQQCHRGVIKPLAEAILGRMQKDGGEAKDANLGLGLAMYDYSIPARAGKPAEEQTSMLSVFQTGKWIVKTRVTLPKSENSYEAACNYGGITSVAQARVITRKDGPAV